MKEPGMCQKIRWKLSVTGVTASHLTPLLHRASVVAAATPRPLCADHHTGCGQRTTVFKNERPQTPPDAWGPRETVIQHCDGNTVQPRVFSSTKAVGAQSGQTKFIMISMTCAISARFRVGLPETELNKTYGDETPYNTNEDTTRCNSHATEAVPTASPR